MADLDLRQTRRYLQTHPEDYSTWYAYLTAGARQGQYDPMIFKSYVTFVTGVSEPNAQDFQMDVPAIPEPTAAQLEWMIAERARFTMTQQEWYRAGSAATTLIHNIRNKVGGQWDKYRLANYFNGKLSQLYTFSRVPDGCLHIPEKKLDDPWEEAAIKIDSHSIWYNEEMHVIRQIQERHGRARHRWVTEPKSVLDLTPQYILMAEIYHPGNREQPGESEEVEIAATPDPKTLLEAYIWSQEENAMQEAYLSPDDYSEEFVVRTLRSRIQFAEDTLRANLNSNSFKDAPRITRGGPEYTPQNLTIHLEDSQQIILWHFDSNFWASISDIEPGSGLRPRDITSCVETLEGVKCFSHDESAFNYIWRYWLRNRLAFLLTEIPARKFRRRYFC